MRVVPLIVAAAVLSVSFLEAQKPGAQSQAVAPASGGDPYVGTFVGQTLSISLQRNGAYYVGSAASQGGQYQLQAQLANGVMTGIYNDNGMQRSFQAVVQGDVMQLVADGTQFMLQRQGGGRMGVNGTAPVGPAAPAPGGAAPGGGQLATTPQDQQIAQLLLSSRWCSFQYSQVSGRTSTEQVQYFQNGTVVQGQQSETQSSNPNGQYYGNSQNGNRGMWRIQNGMLMLSQDGAQWAPIQLQFSRNSNGYPIVTANGKEYSQCN